MYSRLCYSGFHISGFLNKKIQPERNQTTEIHNNATKAVLLGEQKSVNRARKFKLLLITRSCSYLPEVTVRPMYVHITPVASGAEIAAQRNWTDSATTPCCACNNRSEDCLSEPVSVSSYRRAGNGRSPPKKNAGWLGCYQVKAVSNGMAIVLTLCSL